MREREAQIGDFRLIDFAAKDTGSPSRQAGATMKPKAIAYLLAWRSL